MNFELLRKVLITMLGVSLIALVLAMFVTTFVFPDDAPIQKINLFYYVKAWFLGNPEKNIIFVFEIFFIMSIISMFIGVFLTRKNREKQ